jgi:hypothetical protein
MLKQWVSLAWCAALALISIPAKADLVHPENGAWWNPAASGSGLQVEIQDTIVTVTFFGYDVRGQATFYLMAGVFDTVNQRFVGDVQAFTNGPCVGCPYNPPASRSIGQGAAVFSSRTRGFLTLPTLSGSVTFPIERYSYGYGGTPERQMLGAWFTTLVYPTGLPEGDLLLITRTEVDSAGPYVVGRLYPDNALIIGERISIPGNRNNFVWFIELNSTQDAVYIGELSLTGISGNYAVMPRGAPIPSRPDAFTFGARLAGPGSIAQALAPRGAGVTDAAMDELGKRRADLGSKSGAQKPFTVAELKTLNEMSVRMRARAAQEPLRAASQGSAQQ